MVSIVSRPSSIIIIAESGRMECFTVVESISGVPDVSVECRKACIYNY